MSKTKEIIEESFGQYAGAVAQSRAFVDVRDALKPSNRLINYCLFTDKFLPSKPFKKTLKAIGSIARMYIHGDSSAEGIIMRSGQPFAMRYPLMEIEGNGGNLKMSGNWAASRYTSARLSKYSTLMFDDINKNTIDTWLDNYDDTEKYPTVLPSKGFYNIVNGTSGIGVGVASSIPQFNLREVNKALEVLLLNPDCSFDDIYCIPDFATYGFLINEAEVKEALRYGSKKLAKANNENGASCKLRAKIDYNKKENCLIVTEIPYSVYTSTICEQLENIMEDDENNPGIDRFNDLTGTSPLIKIYLTKGADPYRIMNFLYKNTSLQYHFAINMTMLDGGKYPKIFSWKEALQAHIDHEKIVYKKGFEFELNKIDARIHIIDGLLICLANINEVVKTIKKSNSTAIAKENLIKNFLLDEEQAKAVLDMKLARLAHLEVEKLKNEKTELQKEHERISAILNNVDLFNQELIKTWRYVAEKFGDDRRTQVITVIESKQEKEIEYVKPEEVVVMTTQSGLIKRIPLESFKIQRRNTKGIKSEDDIIISSIKTNTIDNMMLFTDKGTMYRVLVDNIPSTTMSAKGTHISTLTKIGNNEHLMAVSSLHRKTAPKYVIFITEQGMIKKTLLEEYFKTNRNSGIQALTLNDGDKLAKVLFQDEEDILIVTKKGMSIRFKTDDINPIGRVARGVKGIKLAKGDTIRTAMSVHKETDYLAIITTNGLGKKVDLSEFPTQGRTGKGTCCSDTEIAGAAMVDNNDNILIVGKPNSLCISATDIPLLGKKASGNKMIKSGSIVSISKV